MVGFNDIKNLGLFALSVLAFFISPQLTRKFHRRPVWKTEHLSWLDKVSPNSDETWKDRYSSWIQNDLTAKYFTAR